MRIGEIKGINDSNGDWDPDDGNYEYGITGSVDGEEYRYRIDQAKNDIGYIVYNYTNNKNYITIKNTPKINLVINKLNSLTKSPLAGVKFDITLTNIEAIDGYSVTGTGTVKINGVEVNDNGQLNLSGIVPKTLGTPISVTIEEIEVPEQDGYYYEKLAESIIFEISTTNGVYSTGNLTGNNQENGTSTVSTNGNTINVQITNQPYIDLSGMVWQDGQTGAKNVSGPDGTKNSWITYEYVGEGKGNYNKKDDTYEYVGEEKGSYNKIYEDVGEGNGSYKRQEYTETGIKGVLVGLYDSNNNIITTETTDENGTYAFTKIPMTKEGYQIVFSYDGINWIETKASGTTGKDSVANEDGRDTFNARFTTITSGKSNDGTVLSYSYDEDKKTSKLDVNMDGTNPANNNASDFRMNAKTGIYTTTKENIDCGLVEKDFDLALGTDIKEAKVEINDKTTTYTYAQIMNGELEDDLLDTTTQNNSSTENVTYNLYLYKSDYNYRISDYKTQANGGIKNKTNEDDDDSVGFDNLKQLEVYVKYSVILKNQTTKEGTVNEFVYYYDSKYEPAFKVGDTIDDYVISNIENNKITLTSNKDASNKLNADNSYRKEIDLEFAIKQNTNDNNNLYTGKFTNIGEITSYSSTEGGLIDRDSAPGNGISNGAITQYEDDADQAHGINVSVPDSKVRTITGTVFADVNKNGTNNNSDTAVNDVIVQLIEIKKISGQYYEYIWQETRSGSGTVKKLSTDGTKIEDQEYREATNDGTYEFTGYIPGNYIIRFIYGDGSTYDVTDNVKTYNGQDYKSTIDANYKESWYAESNYGTNASVARDNEARRLEVMAYSSTIDNTIGTALRDKTTEALENTWMCAETSRINIPVDEDTRSANGETAATTATVSYKNNTSTKVVEVGDMNFGLAERPKTSLVLEKHITGLTITPSGTGAQAIVDAKADIASIVNGTSVDATGVTEGLATIKSTRTNRGFWEVATDLEELAQGAELEVEYTYVIRNDSEEDYLSETLVGAYEKQDTKPYSEALGEIKTTVKGTMRSGTYSYSNSNVIGTYLGEWYYTGEKGANDAPVSSRIEELEEAINEDLTFDKTTSGEDFKEVTDETELNSKTYKDVAYDTNGTAKSSEVKQVITNVKPSEYLTRKTRDDYTANTDVDYNKTVTLRTVLSSISGGELGANLPSYIAQIVSYSNAAGRRDTETVPENLSYVNSEDTEMTMETNNERDEFWGETIIITKPTGEDKLTPMQIGAIVVASIGVVGVGIILIKKIVLKK